MENINAVQVLKYAQDYKLTEHTGLHHQKLSYATYT